MPCKLSVNVNAIAYLRNRRNLPWPSVEGLGRVALEAGAVGLTVHPRPDERHIRRSDVTALGQMLRRDFPHAEFNIEGYPSVYIVDAEGILHTQLHMPYHGEGGYDTKEIDEKLDERPAAALYQEYEKGARRFRSI